MAIGRKAWAVWPTLAYVCAALGCSSPPPADNSTMPVDGGGNVDTGSAQSTSPTCDGGSLPTLPSKTSYTVGFVQTYESGNPWRTANTDDIVTEAANRGDTMVYTPPTMALATQQAMQMQALIDQKVDAIILCPMDATVLAPTVVEAREACIPVFTENRLLNSTLVIAGMDYVSAIGGDPNVQGKVIADWLINATNGQATIIELEGTVGSSSAIGRKAGFASEIMSHPGMTVVDSQTGNFTQQGGHDTALALLMAHPTADTVFSHNDLMALGAIQAITELGKKPGTDVKIVSIDGSQAGTQAILNGQIAAIEVNDPRLGKAVFDAIHQYGMGTMVPTRIVTTGPVIDITTAAAYLPKAF